MSWGAWIGAYLTAGFAVALTLYSVERLTGRRQFFSEVDGFNVIFCVAIWPLAMIFIPLAIFDGIKEKIKPKIPPLESRCHAIDPYLRQLGQDGTFSPSQLLLIRKSYDWVESGWPPRNSSQLYSWPCNPDLFDLLLVAGEQQFIDENHSLWRDFHEGWADARKSGVFGTPPTENFKIFFSPHFAKSFHLLSQEIKEMIARELKSIAPQTLDVGEDGWPLCESKSFKMNGPLPCMIMSRHTALVIEPSKQGVCFIGFISSAQTGSAEKQISN